jgi:adenosylmethionine-8-amino-7-oxononanoate aminotransferase
MTTAPFQDWDRDHVWHPYTRLSAAQMGSLPMIVRGDGLHLFDAEGRRYVDAISSWWCAALGHSHPRIVAAIQIQAGQLQHSILGHLSHPQAAQLAYRLAHLMPTPDRHVLFASDGASAVEQALKIAVQYQHAIGQTQRTRFACLADAYHGDTLGAMAVGYQEAWHRPFKPLLSQPVALPLPTETSGWQTAEDVLTPAAHELAAVIVEPLCLGAAGMKMYPASWLARLAAWCQSHGVLLIDDEIAMGFGRTGRMFAFEHAGIDPDLVCVGKALSAGYLPISATLARNTLYRVFDDEHTLQHGHTFCGNPLAAAAANEALQVYEEMQIAEWAATLGAVLQDALAPLAQHPRVQTVRCLGLIGVVELRPEKDAPSVALPHRIRLRLQQMGVLLRPLDNTLYLMPPLIITREQLQDLCRVFTEAIQETP